MAVCVIGGAGYIGSVCVEKLVEAGRKVVVYDNLSKGHKSAIVEGATFVRGDHGDEKFLKETLLKFNCSAVMHFSALSLVGESVEKPLLYYENNVAKGVALLRAVIDADIKHFIFSSTAATYGETKSIPITEKFPTIPTNPYGNTKLAFEKLLRDSGKAYGLRSVILRYFNAAGATEKCGEDHSPESHLIPIILQVAAGKRNSIKIFGNDYPTPDGTCVRDYIHISDIARAHLLALKHLENGGKSDFFNMGNGSGFSVLQVIETVEKVTGKNIPREITPRRAGDPSTLIASSDKIREALGWHPEFPDLESIIESAWKWHESHPEGYID
jgi:UDP-glucose 4-epimerase